MDEMAKMLESYAGGLQQSFESVFQRVDQSLAQSAEVMRMMNEVMESVMLQNLLLLSSYDVNEGLTVAVENRSQVTLGQTKVSARLHDADRSFFSVEIESLPVGQKVQFHAPLHDAVVGPVAGFLELQCTSPGTQQTLTKRSPFRVLYFQQGRFEAALSGEEMATPGSGEVAAVSDKLLLTRVRQLLNISPIQGILTAEKGRYCYIPAAALNNDYVLYLSVEESGAGNPAYRVTVSAAGSADTTEGRRRRCQEIIDEMEIVE
uniref:Uncharacterized protein n=1 Tax=Hyaloperonospora arabidopsidis (strain Emoy2) TaxID=559515 RepID=M4C0I7_HYAAE